MICTLICAVYAALFLVWLGTYFYNKSLLLHRRRQIKEMYNDPSLPKMEYDFANYDDRTERLISASHAEGQLSIDDLMLDAPASTPDEGLEEITGNYKPD